MGEGFLNTHLLLDLFNAALILKTSIENCPLDIVPVGICNPWSRNLSHIFWVLRATLNITPTNSKYWADLTYSKAAPSFDVAEDQIDEDSNKSSNTGPQ